MKVDERKVHDEKIVKKINEVIDYTKGLENKIVELETRIAKYEKPAEVKPTAPQPAAPSQPVQPAAQPQQPAQEAPKQ
jgi:hypothetical protein